RTRTVTAFARAAQNGVGRNFFVEQYLREGDYQITVATQGQSKGHLGLTLERTQMADGGVLSEGGPARRALAAGEAVAYRFTIAEAGDHRVRSFRAGPTFRRRPGDGDGAPARVATVPPGRGWKGKLEMGRYRLDLVCARPNNRVTYELGVWPEQLVAGLDRDVSAPGTVPLSVGRDGLVQLASFGSADVRARVYDAGDHLVAENDDGADDWNFQIQARLA